MKPTIQTLSILAAAILTPFAFAEHHEGGHDDHKGHDHAEEAGHDDHAKETGPNGGRVLHEVEPHAELFVTEDRKIQITFLDDEGKAAAPGDQKITAVTGKRSSPTRLKFTKTDTGFLSDQALPAGNNIPAVIIIKAGEQKTNVKLNLNLVDCPTCDFKEYACICDHSEDGDHEDHDHDGDGKPDH